jgi:hypothetical protein
MRLIVETTAHTPSNSRKPHCCSVTASTTKLSAYLTNTRDLVPPTHGRRRAGRCWPAKARSPHPAESRRPSAQDHLPSSHPLEAIARPVSAPAGSETLRVRPQAIASPIGGRCSVLAQDIPEACLKTSRTDVSRDPGQPPDRCRSGCWRRRAPQAVAPRARDSSGTTSPEAAPVTAKLAAAGVSATANATPPSVALTYAVQAIPQAVLAGALPGPTAPTRFRPTRVRRSPRTSSIPDPTAEPTLRDDTPPEPEAASDSGISTGKAQRAEPTDRGFGPPRCPETSHCTCHRCTCHRSDWDDLRFYPEAFGPTGAETGGAIASSACDDGRWS